MPVFSPAVFVAKGTGSWTGDFLHAMNVSTQKLKPYGPLAIFMGDADSDAESMKDVSRDFCWVMNRENSSRACFEEQHDFIQAAATHQASASTSFRAYSDYGDHCDSQASGVFIEQATILVVNQGGQGCMFTGLHEYTHTYQMHFLPRLDPCWLAEGSADYHAYHESFNFPSLKGFRPGMHDALYNIKQMLAKAPQMRLQMMEDSNNMPPKVQQYYHELAYDEGAWAVAYMIHRHSHATSEPEFWRTFWPSISALGGWRQAVAAYADCTDIHDFYAKFDAFIRQDDTAAIKAILEGQ